MCPIHPLGFVPPIFRRRAIYFDETQIARNVDNGVSPG